MVSDVAYSIADVRIFLREMPASCLKELRVSIPSLRFALATACVCVTRLGDLNQFGAEASTAHGAALLCKCPTYLNVFKDGGALRQTISRTGMVTLAVEVDPPVPQERLSTTNAGCLGVVARHVR